MTRPLRQSVELQFVHRSALPEAETWTAPRVYGRNGQPGAIAPPPGSIFQVRV